MTTPSKHLFLLTAVVIGTLAALALTMYGGKPIYPIVRAQAPGGVTLTFIGPPWNDADRCAKDNQRAEGILRKQCPRCSIEFSGCREQLNPSWEKSYHNEPTDLFAVHTDVQLMVIEAAPNISREICIGMAGQIEQQGKLHARCVEPVL